MKKADFISGVAEKASISKKDAGIAVEAVLEQLSDIFKAGDSISLVGFGTFKCSVRKARKGKNPATGAEINIPETKTVTFKPGKELKGSL